MSKRAEWELCTAAADIGMKPGCSRASESGDAGAAPSESDGIYTLQEEQRTAPKAFPLRERCFRRLPRLALARAELKTTLHCSEPRGGDAIKCHPVQRPSLQPGTEKHVYLQKKERERRKSRCCSAGNMKYLEGQNAPLLRI